MRETLAGIFVVIMIWAVVGVRFEIEMLVILNDGVETMFDPPPPPPPPLETGGGVTAFDTVTRTLADVPMFPAASYAFVARIWIPFERLLVLREKVYGAVLSVPWMDPSITRATEVIPTLSEAEAVMDAVPERVPPDMGAVMLVVGGVVSGVELGVEALVKQALATPESGSVKMLLPHGVLFVRVR